MSTSINYTFQQDTNGSLQLDEMNSYRYGREETSLQAQEEIPLIKPRTPRKLEKISNAATQIEEIKQIWNGIVIDFRGDEFTARLEDLTNPDNPDEIVVLAIDEIDKRIQQLVQTGAMFIWHIGYRSGPKYPRQRFSKISFRRLPKWTLNEIQSAEKLAEEYADFFHPNPANPS